MLVSARCAAWDITTKYLCSESFEDQCYLQMAGS
jgi:hypothetical protein